MHSERPQPPEVQSLGEKIMDKPKSARAAILLLSGLIHGGGAVAYHYRDELSAMTKSNISAIVDGADNLLLRIRVAKQDAAFSDPRLKKEIDPQVIQMLKEGQPPMFDLSETYLASEALFGDYSDQEIAKAMERYQSIVDNARTLRDQGKTEEEVMDSVLSQQGNYEKSEAFLMDLLLDDKGNCEARMKLMTATAQDIYPEWVEKNALFVQNFPAWQDQAGEIYPAHVRAVVRQGSSLLVLEGEHAYKEPRPNDAQLLNARWIASASLLVKQGAVSFEDLGLHSAKRLTGDDLQTTSILIFPQSSSLGYTGSANKNTHSLALEKKDESNISVAPVRLIGELSDKQVLAHEIGRKDALMEDSYQRHKEQSKLADQWEKEFGQKVGVSTISSDYLDLSKSTLNEPLTDEMLEKFVSIYVPDLVDDDGLNITLRPNQDLPTHAQSILDDRHVGIRYTAEPTLDKLTEMSKLGFSNFTIYQTTRVPEVLYTSSWLQSSRSHHDETTNMIVYFQPRDFPHLTDLVNYDPQKYFNKKALSVHLDLILYDTIASGNLNGLKVQSLKIEDYYDYKTPVHIEASAMVGAEINYVSIDSNSPDGITIDAHAFTGAKINLLRITLLSREGKAITIDPQAFVGSDIAELIITDISGKKYPLTFEGVKKVSSQ